MCEYHSLQYTTAGIAEYLSITTTTQLLLLNANKKNKAKFIPWRYGSSIWEMSKGLEWKSSHFEENANRQFQKFLVADKMMDRVWYHVPLCGSGIPGTHKDANLDRSFIYWWVMANEFVPRRDGEWDILRVETFAFAAFDNPRKSQHQRSLLNQVW